ncbi:MAG: amidophosphoribosyltransferase, partial [Thiohalophilus sp.]
ANKVYFASAAPPVRYPNVYGIDMPAAGELIGHGRNDKEIAQEIGADKLIYQDLSDLIEAVKKKVPRLERFDTSVFDGIYVTGNVSEAYLQHIESLRNDKARKQDTGDNEVVEIRNTM